MSSQPQPTPARIAASGGFTLIELMIVLAIIAILAAIAYPSYNAYVIRSNRSAAQACLAQYANYMERYYTTHLRYDQNDSGTANPYIGTAPGGTAKDMPNCASAAKTGSRYKYTVTAPTPTSTSPAAIYTLTAEPQGAQAGDTECLILQLIQDGTSSVSGPDSQKNCWKN